MLHDHFSHLHLGFSRSSSFGMTGAIGMVCISYAAKAFVFGSGKFVSEPCFLSNSYVVKIIKNLALVQYDSVLVLNELRL